MKKFNLKNTFVKLEQYSKTNFRDLTEKEEKERQKRIKFNKWFIKKLFKGFN